MWFASGSERSGRSTSSQGSRTTPSPPSARPASRAADTPSGSPPTRAWPDSPTAASPYLDRASGLPDASVNALAPSPRAAGDALWIGTEGGLALLAGGRTRTWTTADELPNRPDPGAPPLGRRPLDRHSGRSGAPIGWAFPDLDDGTGPADRLGHVPGRDVRRGRPEGPLDGDVRRRTRLARERRGPFPRQPRRIPRRRRRLAPSPRSSQPEGPGSGRQRGAGRFASTRPHARRASPTSPTRPLPPFPGIP